MRLLLLMVKEGFFPCDEHGNIIYVFEPYGFAVLFMTDKKGDPKDLEEAVDKAIHEVDSYVGAQIVPLSKGKKKTGFSACECS